MTCFNHSHHIFRIRKIDPKNSTWANSMLSLLKQIKKTKSYTSIESGTIVCKHSLDSTIHLDGNTSAEQAHVPPFHVDICQIHIECVYWLHNWPHFPFFALCNWSGVLQGFFHLFFFLLLRFVWLRTTNENFYLETCYQLETNRLQFISSKYFWKSTNMCFWFICYSILFSLHLNCHLCSIE